MLPVSALKFTFMIPEALNLVGSSRPKLWDFENCVCLIISFIWATVVKSLNSTMIILLDPSNCIIGPFNWAQSPYNMPYQPFSPIMKDCHIIGPSSPLRPILSCQRIMLLCCLVSFIRSMYIIQCYDPNENQKYIFCTNYL